MTEPGWYPDPTAQFTQRYWDGSTWTPHVADAAGNTHAAPVSAAPAAGPTGSTTDSGTRQSGTTHVGRGSSGAHAAQAPAGMRLTSSPLRLPAEPTEMVWSEAIRPIGDDGWTLAQATGLDMELRNSLGHGLQRTIMCAEDRPIITDDYNMCEFAFDPRSGVVAAAGGLSHHSFGFPGGLDLGLRDGRTAFTWSNDVPDALQVEVDYLYLGNAHTGRLEADRFTGSIGGLSVAPDGTRVAWIEWRGPNLNEVGSPGFVFEQDLATGQRRLITITANFSGAGPVRYSADGSWLLVDGRVLIRLTDDHVLELSARGEYAWAPGLGTSTLLHVHRPEQKGPVLLALLDLSSGTEQELGPVETDEDPLHVSSVEVHPTDNRVLCCSPHGHLQPFRDGHGARAKVQLLDLETRRLTPVTSPVVNGNEQLERDQSRPRWLATAQVSGLVALADERANQLTAPARPAVAAGGMLDDCALMVIQRCGTDLEPDRSTRSPARVRVELIRACQHLVEGDQLRGRALVEQLREFTFPLAMQVLMQPIPTGGSTRPRDPMLAVDVGLQYLVEGHFEDYDWTKEAYTAW